MRIRDSILFLAAALCGCGKDAPKTPTPEVHGEHEEHVGKHGGHVLELGEHEGHLEIVHDDAAGTLQAYVYDAKMEPVATDAPVVNLAKGGTQVPMTALAGATPAGHAWTATHEGLKGEPEGRVRVKIGAKTFNPELEHEHEHPAK